MTGVIIKRRKIVHRDRHGLKGEIHANMNEEIGVLYLQAKEHQKLPGNHQMLKQTEQTTPSQPSEGTNTVDTLISNY